MSKLESMGTIASLRALRLCYGDLSFQVISNALHLFFTQLRVADLQMSVNSSFAEVASLYWTGEVMKIYSPCGIVN